VNIAGRALGCRLLGRLEQPFQTEKPLLEELEAQVGQRQRGGRIQRSLPMPLGWIAAFPNTR